MMRFTVDARAFSDAMSKVSKVLRKNPIPILEEIAVCIQNGRCTLTATDLETWLVAELPARGDDMSFVFSRTKDVMKACAHFEGELAITFVPKDEKDGKIEVLCEQRAAEFSTASYVRFAGQELSMNVPSGRFTTRVSMVGRGDLTIGFNLRYMLDALKQFRKEPTVRIKLSGPYTPIVVEAEGRSDFALVLPVRLRDEMAA